MNWEMIKMSQKISTCIFCKRIISEHSRRESIDCALKLCNKMGIASSARGTGDQLNKKIHGYAPNGVSR